MNEHIKEFESNELKFNIKEKSCELHPAGYAGSRIQYIVI